MAELVGGAVLSASLQVLFERLASKQVVDFVHKKKSVDKLLHKLKIKLLSVNRVLSDAEHKQIRDPLVRTWLDELKEAIYDAGDLIYEIDAEASQREIDGEEVSGSSSVIGQVSELFSDQSLRAFEKEMETKIEEVLDRLGYIVEEKDVLGLKENNVAGNRMLLGLPQVAFVEENGVFGRDADKAAIIRLLLSDDIGIDKFSVIPIVGMGGIGKTTLAQLVYNEDVIREHFDLRVWVSVSDAFDLFRIMKTILDGVTAPNTCGAKDLFESQVQLKKSVEGKKFLFVLDDVWNENYMSWHDLKSPFESGKHGSKIILTTRNERVASMMGCGVSINRLKMLSDDDSWNLFAKHAFHNENQSALPELEAIGRQIVKKCNGLPLAIKSLGGLLRAMPNVEEWENVLQSDIWELSGKEHNILPALWLSYQHLPEDLRRCFAYCSIFPKNCVICRRDLIFLWMAEGLLQPRNGKRMVDLGHECFQVLVLRSLFQRHNNYPGCFTIHDLMHDLATFISGKFRLMLDGETDLIDLSRKTRHVSLVNEKINMNVMIKKFEDLVLSEGSTVRTFLSCGSPIYLRHSRDKESVLPAIQKRRCLRALSLQGYKIAELPNSITHLKQLRYLKLSGATFKEIPRTIGNLFNLEVLQFNICKNLVKLPDSIGKLKKLQVLDLSSCGIVELPNSVCDLHNLEELILTGCSSLVRLPSSIVSLTKLHHLGISGTKIPEMPLQIGNMKCLRELSDFVLSERTGPSIKELGNLQKLKGELRISGLQNVEMEDAQKANLKNTTYLSSLTFAWNGKADDSEKEKRVVESLQPHTNIENLSINFYAGTRFPNWIGDHSFDRVTLVRLIGCRNCFFLPPLGQLPSLRSLDIDGCHSVVKIGTEFCSNGSPLIEPFKSLQSLELCNMLEWQEWSFFEGCDKVCTVFPHLQQLTVFDCPKLQVALPGPLPSLTTLDVNSCKQLKALVPGSLQIDPALPTLHWLKIERCEELEPFSTGGLPSSLKSFITYRCSKLLEQRLLWDLQRLHSLRDLTIGSSEVLDSFPEEGLLPISLRSLNLCNLSNLKTLNGNGFQQLNCLEQLTISSCPGLECIPEQGLPISLMELSITGCPKLSQRCERETGEDWPKIARIRNLKLR